jgi:dCMP deaminase
MSLNHKDLLKKAYQIATTSRDPSTQNGALIVDKDGKVIATGANNFPNGVKEDVPARWERPLKYKIIEHAERAVIYECARKGLATQGLTMVCAWACCSDCSRAIILSGIKLLVRHKQALDRSPAFWMEEIKIANQLLEESGVSVMDFDGEIGGTEKILHSGQFWLP